MQQWHHLRDIVVERKLVDNSYTSYSHLMAATYGQITQTIQDSQIGPAGANKTDTQLKAILSTE